MSNAPPHRTQKRRWLWTDAILFAAATAVLGQNILQNPGFEAGTEGWFIVGSRETRIEIVAERPHSGAAACRVSDRASLYCGIAMSVRDLILLSAILAALLLAWLAARSRRGEQARGSPMDPPPLEGAGATRTARWPWAVGIAAVLLLIPLALITGWLLLRDSGKAVPQVSPEEPTLRQGTFEETLRNPGFEEGLQSWAWPGAWWTISTTTHQVHSGRQAAIVSDRTESWQGIGQSLLGRIEPGRLYYCSARVRIENAPQAIVTMHVSKVDDSRNGVTRHRFLGSRTVVENEWTEIHGTYLLDDLTGTLKTLFFSIAGPPPGVNLLVDDVSLKPVQDAIPQPRKVRGGMSRNNQPGTKSTLQQADTNGVLVLKAMEAEIHGETARYEEAYNCIGFWMVREDYVSWTCEVAKPGRFSVAITYACAPGVEGSQYTVGVEAPAVDSEPREAPGSRITDTVKATGGWSTFITEAPGEIELSAGRHKIAVRALTMQSAVMNLQQLRLSPLP